MSYIHVQLGLLNHRQLFLDQLILSAMIAISVGPANKSIPILPNNILFASATNWFPGPTKISAVNYQKNQKPLQLLLGHLLN